MADPEALNVLDPRFALSTPSPSLQAVVAGLHIRMWTSWIDRPEQHRVWGVQLDMTAIPW